MDWFLYDNTLRHESVKCLFIMICLTNVSFSWFYSFYIRRYPVFFIDKHLGSMFLN